MRFSQVASWAACLGLTGLTVTGAVQLSGNAQDLFNESMDIMDRIYDSSAGYLRYFYYPLAAGPHETRSSAWYAAGLLQRNEGDDASEAIKIIRNIIGSQHKEPGTEWYVSGCWKPWEDYILID